MAEWDYCLELSKQPQLPAGPRGWAGRGLAGREPGCALAKRCGGGAELEDAESPEQGARWGGIPAGGVPGAAGSAPGEVSDPCAGQGSTQWEGEFGGEGPPTCAPRGTPGE